MAFTGLWRSKERHADAGVISTGWQACVRMEGGREEERDWEQMRLSRRGLFYDQRKNKYPSGSVKPFSSLSLGKIDLICIVMSFLL